MLRKLPITKVIRDILLYSQWIKTINSEKRNPNSKFNKYDMRHNAFYNVYVTITLSHEDTQLDEEQKKMRVVEYIAPINRYLDDDLKFAGNLVPEFNQVYNKDDNTPTSTYVIVYRFAFDGLSFKWIVTRTLAVIAIITIYNNVNWSKLGEWIASIL